MNICLGLDTNITFHGFVGKMKDLSDNIDSLSNVCFVTVKEGMVSDFTARLYAADDVDSPSNHTFNFITSKSFISRSNSSSIQRSNFQQKNEYWMEGAIPLLWQRSG